MRADIAKKAFYIKALYNVVKTNNTNARRFIHVESRNYDVFAYILSGSCTYIIDGGDEFTVSKGDIFYLPNKESYTVYIHDTDYSIIFCDFLFDGDEARRGKVYKPKNGALAENAFTKLLHCHSGEGHGSFYECMSLLYDIYGIISSSENGEYIGIGKKSKISEARSFIDANYKNPSLSLANLAEKFGMSEVYFRRLFKAQNGVSPSQYLISVRLSKAKELMEYPILGIEDCALQSGFSSHQYFCRVFKKAIGVSPMRYRQTVLKK